MGSSSCRDCLLLGDQHAQFGHLPLSIPDQFQLSLTLVQFRLAPGGRGVGRVNRLDSHVEKGSPVNGTSASVRRLTSDS